MLAGDHGTALGQEHVRVAIAAAVPPTAPMRSMSTAPARSMRTRGSPSAATSSAAGGGAHSDRASSPAISARLAPRLGREVAIQVGSQPVEHVH